MTSRLIIFFIGIGISFSSFGQTYQKRLALVIGNSSYQNGGTLKNPVNDARAMAGALQAMGFEVLRHENVTQVQMKQAINSFGQKLRDFEVGLFYYAGHGIQHQGRNYMIPVEADLQAAEQIEFDCVAADRIMAYMESADTKVNIIIMDACRNNPFERSWNRSTSGNGLAMMNAPTGSLIAYATAPGSVASDGENANGLYTSVLLKYMKDPALNLEQVFKRVRTEVTEKSSGAQVPWETTSLTGGDFFLTASITTTEETKTSNFSKESREINALGEDPAKALEYYTQAQEKYGLALYEEAIELYSKALEYNPLDFQAYLWRGHSKYSLGYLNSVINSKMLEEAIIDYSKTIQLNPGDSEAYYYRANSKKLLQKYNEAIPDFTLSLRYDPKKSESYYYRGLTYYLLEKYGAAAEDLTKTIELSPENPDNFYWRGASYYGLEEYARSLEDFDKAIELNPDYFDAYLYKADAYYSLQNYDTAIQFYEFYTKHFPNSTTALIYIAHCHYNQGSYDMALSKYHKVLTVDVNYADAYYWRSHLYFYGLKNKDKAIQEIKKALAINPIEEKYLILQEEELK